MSPIQACKLPDAALLRDYQQAGHYTDCYAMEIGCEATHAQYVEAFYTTPVFRLERLILRWAVAKPSTDAQAHALALGTTDAFAAWTVEARRDDQFCCAITGAARAPG